MNKEKAKTPLMEQYMSIKSNHKDAVLFFRMGDFYEMFFDDAKTGSKVLGITLTSRAHGKAANVPLAGFPYHALDGYLAKMIKAGYRVAICEQVEDPKLAKIIVKREVTEIVTPGTTVTDDLLETKRNNYLVSIHFDANRCGLAKVDVSTGEFQLTEFPQKDFKEKIVSIGPSELLVSESNYDYALRNLDSLQDITVTKRDDWTFHYDYARETLTDHFGTLSLKGFGVENLDKGISAAGAIIIYLRENQKGKLQHINRLSRFSEDDILLIDSTTRRNLELIQSMTGGGKVGTLLSVIDGTLTPMGGRMLVHWLLFPLQNLQKIKNRLDAVQGFVDAADRRKKIRDTLGKAGDLERLVARFATGRANARDANAVLATLQVIAAVKSLLADTKVGLLQHLNSNLDPLEKVVKEIESAVVDDPPLSITDGGLIRRGYNEDLDKLRDIAYSGKDWIARLQKKNGKLPAFHLSRLILIKCLATISK